MKQQMQQQQTLQTMLHAACCVPFFSDRFLLKIPEFRHQRRILFILYSYDMICCSVSSSSSSSSSSSVLVYVCTCVCTCVRINIITTCDYREVVVS